MSLEDQAEIPLILDVEDVIVATVGDVPAYLDDREAADNSDRKESRSRRKPTKVPVDEDSNDASLRPYNNQSDSDTGPSKQKGKGASRRFTAAEKGKGKAKPVAQDAGKGKEKEKDVTHAPGKRKGRENPKAKAQQRSKAFVQEESTRNENAEAGPSNPKPRIVQAASDDNVETGLSSPRLSRPPVPVPVNQDSDTSTAGITVDPQIFAAVMQALRVFGVNIPNSAANGQKRDRQFDGDDDNDHDNAQGSSKKQRTE